MIPYNIVIDTNVIVSALRSRNGYSFDLLSIIDDDRFNVGISVPLILEYEDAILKSKSAIKLSLEEIDDILDYICLIGDKRKIFFLWRPFLKDLKDDMILELAVEARCDFIISFNKKDFAGSEKFNIEIVTPKEFLKMIGEI
ncbi:MAG: putative toxin-antitoxin system toxin component, PIN family [Melioribacteraceae bacterium]|jgi:putative PIN family toxin of toxin-antitoxin system|nr:putative toxin-antitoxin system toxin component, PIN family [Melioribacteraceae bacterium]RJP58571.1 MAG: putative toxin-antitoxin system toxin component, PIN family [Ignavibacteriales bacterium]WKZ68185.1 MAG: putative toxin-antitoxin system toxin component, PIN family [Melioribacteraceae bacterium]